MSSFMKSWNKPTNTFISTSKSSRVGLILIVLGVAIPFSFLNFSLQPNTTLGALNRDEVSVINRKERQHSLSHDDTRTSAEVEIGKGSNTDQTNTTKKPSPDPYHNNHKDAQNISITSTTKPNSIGVDEFLKFKIAPKQFPKYQHEFPCLPKSFNGPKGTHTGFQYIKVFKTASSTVAHIVKYIADKRGHCKEFSNHAAAHTFPQLKAKTPNQSNSFLFTFVREPTKRAVSDFFYTKVTQANEEVNLENFQNGCCRAKQGLYGQAGFQLAYISTKERLPQYTFWNDTLSATDIQRPYQLLDRVNHVFDTYDFIGVSDRLNESLVALSFLLDLSLVEIAYVSYRQSGSYLGVQKRCVKIVEARLTPDIEEYLETDEWKAITAADRLLYRTATEALDNTIDNVIGRDVFEKRMSDYEELLTYMKECDEECSSTCTVDGKYRDPISCRPCMSRKRKQWLIGQSS